MPTKARHGIVFDAAILLRWSLLCYRANCRGFAHIQKSLHKAQWAGVFPAFARLDTLCRILGGWRSRIRRAYLLRYLAGSAAQKLDQWRFCHGLNVIN